MTQLHDKSQKLVPETGTPFVHASEHWSPPCLDGARRGNHKLVLRRQVIAGTGGGQS
ncbi:MAG TPA: hypothetical protein VFU02_06070 [Polyangiaceae bacterium]|nr:hypothetical protein [Polyangiaceae bacterium]